MNPPFFKHRLPITRMVLTVIFCVGVLGGCAGSPDDSRAGQGAAVGAGIGLLVGVLSGDSEVAARAVAVGAAAGAYEGWRQDQHDERTRQITQTIHESNASSQQTGLDAEARQRENLTRFLGVWQMSGWLQEPGGGRVNVSAQVNGNIHMTYFVEMAYIDFNADGLDQQIWGTTTFGYDADTGFEFSTRFNTLPDALEASGGTFDSASRSFIFADSSYRTTIRFETPDRFTVTTTALVNGREQTVESYQFTRS